MLKNPDAPATEKQKYYLQQLTGEDYLEKDMTMQEASDKIQELEMKKVAHTIVDNGKKPFEEAHITLIEADQGQGKSVTAVALVKDAYRNDCVRIYCEEVLKIQCKVKAYNGITRVARILYKGKTRHIRIPTSYKLHSPMRIFANYHLFGIPYVYCPTFYHILDWLKQDIINDGWLLIDETYIGIGAHDSMTKFGKEWRKQGFQYRKMMLEVVIITPIASLIEKYLRLTPTRHIMCSYNKYNGEVTLEITEKGVPGKKYVTYDSKPYRKNYKTNERIKQ